jgi:hypothetical protein
VVDQRLVDELHRLGPGRLVAADDDEPVVGELLRQGPLRITKLAPLGDPPRAGSGPGLDQLDEQVAGEQLAFLGEPVVDRLCVLGEGALDFADRLVAVVGELTRRLLGPQQRQGELEQGQPPRLGPHVLDDPVDEAVGEPDAHGGGRLLDGIGQLLGRHRPQEVGRVLEHRSKRRMVQGLLQEVGPHRQDDRQGGRAKGTLLGDGVRELVEEAVPGVGIRAQREELLELVGHDEVAAAAVAPLLRQPVHDVAKPEFGTGEPIAHRRRR